jgi:hypothetical protein
VRAPIGAKAVSTKEGISREESVPLPFESAAGELMHSISSREKPLLKISLLSRPLLEAKLRDDNLAPSHEPRVRGEYHIRPPIRVFNILEPSSKAKDVVMKVHPLRGSERFFRCLCEIHPRIDLVSHVVILRLTNEPTTVGKERRCG